MDNRRTLTLFLLFTVIWFWVAPSLFPGMFPKPQPRKPPVVNAEADEAAGQAAAAVNPANPAAPVQLADHPEQTVILGPQESASTTEGNTLMRVVLTSRGAAVRSSELLDPRYTTLDRKAPLKVVGNHVEGEVVRDTFETGVAAIDAQLKAHKQNLATAHWEVVPGSQTPTSVTFRYRAPDGSIEVRKKYMLQTSEFAKADTDVRGYMLAVDLTIENLTDNLVKTRYSLLGPAGLPLEDPENARTFVELKAGVLEDPNYPNKVSAVSPLLASTVVSEIDDAAVSGDKTGLSVWRKPIRYAGSDVQYFAALLLPRENQVADGDKDGKIDNYFNEIRPVILHRDRHVERSDVALEFNSAEIELPAKSSKTHKFDLFMGPKRAALMDALDARPVMNYGWWHIISATLLGIMNFFHYTVHLPYFLCIILLTVCVRGVMFPISMKQTAGAAKMKEIQPELTELRKKYSKEPEKFAVAQRDLFRKHNYNPLAGCLPVLFQLPIFIGLYNALYYAIDLRLAPFLWVDNLAAPDALFKFPGPIPLLGWHEFNLLPLLTVALFITQQRMMMPTAETEEQRLTNKMMNFMTIFMGFMFYKSPAGLCIYFIASSLWSLGERKLLDRMKPRIEARQKAKQATRDSAPKKKTFFDKLVEAADEARKQSAQAQLKSKKDK